MTLRTGNQIQSISKKHTFRNNKNKKTRNSTDDHEDTKRHTTAKSEKKGKVIGKKNE